MLYYGREITSKIQDYPRIGEVIIGHPCHGVTVTDVTTGISVFCDTERAQHYNRQKALNELFDKLIDMGIVTEL